MTQPSLQTTVYQPLQLKYRPQTFGGLVGQAAITTTLIQAIEQQRIASAYLFTGPRGTGKTSSARILARSLNCLQSKVPTAEPCGVCEVCRAIAQGTALDIIEIDAASNTGVENIRELIEQSQFAPVQCRYKVYVIDECHMLSTAAFNALLKTLEEPPRNVVFVLATTDPQRVLPTIISRCQRFDFRRIPMRDLVDHLQMIAEAERIAITPQGLSVVAQLSQGGLRDAEGLLDQLSLLGGEITADQVWELVGAVPETTLVELLTALLDPQPESLEQVLDLTNGLFERGQETMAILTGLTRIVNGLQVLCALPNRPDLSGLERSAWGQLKPLQGKLDPSQIQELGRQLQAAQPLLKFSTDPLLWLHRLLMNLKVVAQSIPTGEQSVGQPAGMDLAVLWQQAISSQSAQDQVFLKMGRPTGLVDGVLSVQFSPNLLNMVHSKLEQVQRSPALQEQGITVQFTR